MDKIILIIKQKTMNFLLKILWYIIITLLFLFLVFYTFLSPQYQRIESLKINNNFQKNYSLSWVLVNNLSQLDNIYYTNSGSYTIKNIGNIIQIELWKGKFLFNINDLTKKYIISNKWIEIKPLWTWIFYLDTNHLNNFNNTDINIFSKESLLEIWYKNLKSWKIINNSYLYPHEYMKIKNLILKGINWKEESIIQKNTDFLRIKTQFFKSWYISDKITSSNPIKSTIWKIIWEKNINFLNISIDNINKNYKKDHLLVSYISKLESWDFPWVNYIKEHIFYFYNDAKKIIYYKNKITKNTLQLFNENQIKTYTLRNKIEITLNKLKNIDKEEYNKMTGFINYLYVITEKNNSLSNNLELFNDINIARKINFYDLKLKINTKPKFTSLIYLKSTFNLFDKWKINNLNNNIHAFISYYYTDLRIKENNWELSYNKKNVNKLDYLGFYLKNYISYTLKSNTSIKNSLELINKYIILNKTTYFNNDRINTGIREWILFLNKLKNFIRNNLFNKKRNEAWILVKQSNTNNNIELYQELKNNIDKFNKNIDNNSKLIENKKDYEKIKKNLWEYFEALLNYEKYSLNNDKAKRNLLNAPTIWNNDNLIKLSKEKFLQYIIKFDWINNNSVNNIKVNIINNTYYEVKQIYINGKKMSFNLYPYDWNKISNIYIYWIDKNKQEYYNSSYFLDKQKEYLKQKAMDSNVKNKDKYDFKKFFLNKFFKTNKTPNEITIDKTPKKNKNEEPIIVIFKSEKLLWKRGEFKIIRNIINIKYYDLLVNRIWNIYNIYVNWSLFSIKNNKKIDNSTHWLLYSKYILGTNSHYFENVGIKYYSTYKISNNIKILWVWWNKIKFLWKINILDLENTLKTFFLNKNNIELVYNSIYNTYININRLKINYDILTGQIIYNFKNKNNNIEISFKWSNIINISKNWIKIKGNWSLTNLTNILLTIN